MIFRMKKMAIVAFTVAVSTAMAELGTWKAPSWQAFISESGAVKKIVGGTCPGHSQGMCVTSNAFFTLAREA